MPTKQESATIGTVKVTLKRSPIGRSPRQGQTLQSMGLRRLNQTVELQDTPSTRGMIAKVAHLVSVDE
ncbi:MAG TPA: 50S ribosomal protein L30 [Thermomicrobiales bacterium]|nr:50S ribosomal protein L30 [Thermomicrobiales bacterium]